MSGGGRLPRHQRVSDWAVGRLDVVGLLMSVSHEGDVAQSLGAGAAMLGVLLLVLVRGRRRCGSGCWICLQVQQTILAAEKATVRSLAERQPDHE